MAYFSYTDYKILLKKIYKEEYFKECFLLHSNKEFDISQLQLILSEEFSENLINAIDNFFQESEDTTFEYGEGSLYYDAFKFYTNEKFEIYWIECEGEAEIYETFKDAEKKMEEIIKNTHGE